MKPLEVIKSKKKETNLNPITRYLHVLKPLSSMRMAKGSI